MGTIASTEGPLTITAHSIDGRYGKFYGKGVTTLRSTKTDITLGESIRGIDEDIKKGYSSGMLGVTHFYCSASPAGFDFTLNIRNGSYVASGDVIHLNSANNIVINSGTISSVTGITLMGTDIKNKGGKISSQGPILIKGNKYNHCRDSTQSKPCSRDFYVASYDYPGSGPAILESLDKIEFDTKEVHNSASSIRSGSNLILTRDLYKEEAIQYHYRYWTGQGFYDTLRWITPVILTQSCVLQSADTIQMNLGGFTITGSMNSPVIAIRATGEGLFRNSNRTRTTVMPTTLLLDVTGYIQNQATGSLLTLKTDGAVETEFSMGNVTQPNPNDIVLLGNQPLPLNLANVFNPLSSINLDLHIQSLLSQVAGKVYTRNAKGNNLSMTLWGNAGRWRERTNKPTMTPEDLQSVSEAMLLRQLQQVGTIVQQQTLLCLPPSEINAYQSQGDIVADNFSCVTGGNQTHQNNRIVTQDNLEITSTHGSVRLETQSYTVTSETRECKVSQDFAMPQQQLISRNGDVTVTSHQDLTRIGTAIHAGKEVKKTSETGSVTESPLILKTIVESRHEDEGFFSSTIKTETSLTHSAVSTTTTAGTNLRSKADTEIHQVGTHDTAGVSIEYDAPKTTIDTLLIKNRHEKTSETSGMFSSQSSSSSQETPFAEQATITSPTVTFKGKEATLAGVQVQAKTIHDETEKGIKFVAKVVELLCSQRTTSETPFMSVDAGFMAGFETMVPTMLLVDRIVRKQDSGQILLESVVWDRNKTQIIGKFVETTYQLKQWQVSWHRVEQLISG